MKIKPHPKRRDDIDYEHIRFQKSGEIDVIAFVDEKKIQGVDFWHKIDRAIKEYVEIHPKESWTQLQYNKAIKESRLKNTGATDGNVMRWGISLPMGLGFKIQAIKPDFFEDKKCVHKFMKRYPGWRTCKTV